MIMANLAIRGHATRGKEVIQILEMLGGKISNECGYEDGFALNYAFFIDTNENSFIDGFVLCDKNSAGFSIFTLEEFLEKFPYKIGDKVLYCGNPVSITQMEWIEDSISYHFYYNGRELMLPSKHFQPYKEQETMEEQIKIYIPKGYEVVGVDDDNHQVLLKKIKPKYPNTYAECCKVLDIQSDWHLTFELNNSAPCDLCVNKEFEYVCKLEAFRKLLICRDAYWKVAGEQMGLVKPWEPDWKDTSQSKHSIWFNNEGICIKSNRISYTVQHILTFPTSEMRDTFYENFKDLIKECKEFL